MAIIDANSLEPRAVVRADVCVVGAGAAGITVARSLADSGLSVCLVEGGGLRPEEGTQALYDLESLGYPVRENYMSRARYFGGSCNIWAGRSMLLRPADLEPRAWVPNSAWPIAYSELLAHYSRAAEILRLPPLRLFDEAAFSERTSPHETGLFAGGDLRPAISLWAKKPRRFGAAYHSELRRSRNVSLILNANVTEIVLDDAGNAVERLSASTLAGRDITLQARHFVLACGGMENARLLLVSRGHHSGGVGNRFDLVGRYFMDHPRTVFGKVRLRPNLSLPLLRGVPLRDGRVQFGIGIGRELQKREGLLDHYVAMESSYSSYVEARYQSLINTAKIMLRRGYAGRRWDLAHANLAEIPNLIYLLSPKDVLPHSLYRLYAYGREVLARRKPRSCVLVYFCEQPPDPESRVQLSASRDALGVQRLVLNWKIGGEIERSIMRLQAILRARLAETGIGELETQEDGPSFSDASHHMGTTRMGHTPRDGVVDPDCRVHDLANLFLAGSSVFPSAGHANPTLTLVALSLRLGQHLCQVIEKGA